MQPTILLVDDEQAIRSLFTRYLSKAGFTLSEASSLSEARDAVNSKRFDAALLDLSLPDGNGLDWIVNLREMRPDIPIIVITGVGDIPSAVEAMRRGADHFLTKPVNLADLEVFLRKSLELGSLRRGNLARSRLAKSSEPFFGDSPAMKPVISMLHIAAENDSTVLLHGETGTGKGVFARWIHAHSSRSAMPFVEVNCSSLRGELLSNELFGHVKGAFTSATETRQGLLDVADGGTLFLDEIGDMDLGVQSQFLKVLEEKRYRRLGDVQERGSEFRLICATNRTLIKETERESFRKDLYFRINVIPIEVPPVRARQEDIPELVRYCLRSFESKTQVHSEAMKMLSAYSWPGNVRELKNVLERALLLAGNRSSLEAPHFPGLNADSLLSKPSRQETTPGDSTSPPDLLELLQGDKNQLAKDLGISRATLYRILKALQSRI